MKTGDEWLKLYVWESQYIMICVMASSLEEAFAAAKEQLPDYEYDYLNGEYQVYSAPKAVSFCNTD